MPETVLTALPLPRLTAIRVHGDNSLALTWEDGSETTASLSGLIARNAFFAPLADPALFAQAELEEDGFEVFWPDQPGAEFEHEISLASDQLALLSLEQRPFGNGEFRDWQDRCGLTNRAVADMLDVALSTVALYRADGKIPKSVAIACRHLAAGPMVTAAHFIPRPDRRGRPRQDRTAAE